MAETLEDVLGWFAGCSCEGVGQKIMKRKQTVYAAGVTACFTHAVDANDNDYVATRCMEYCFAAYTTWPISFRGAVWQCPSSTRDLLP
jgi:hypothetical protein